MLNVENLTGTPLNRLAQELASVLHSVLADGAHFLVIDFDPQRHYYVQVMPTDGGGLYCEAVSNQFLSGEARLEPDAEEMMLGLGWASPDPNFKQAWDDPVPVHIVAERLVQTMTKVYGLTDTASIAASAALRSRGSVVPAPVPDPLAESHRALTHCAWVYDHNDDRGGFRAGEMLLRDDGKMYMRRGTSVTGPEGHEYTMSAWEPERAWTGEADVEACLSWMRERGYDLYQPSPVPIDATHAGPFPGTPPIARPLA